MLHSQHIKTISLLALGLSAAVAPAASAKLNPVSGRIPSASIATYGPTGLRGAAPTSIATYGPTGLRGAAPADSQPAAEPEQPSQVIPGGSASGSTNVGPTSRRVIAPNGGFDWGDAGIGAAGGVILSLLGVGCVLVVSQRRARRSRSPAVLAG